MIQVLANHEDMAGAVRDLGYACPRYETDIPSLETNSSPLKNRPGPKRKRICQPSIFRCELLVSGRVYP